MTKGEMKKLIEPFTDSAIIYLPTGPVLDRHDELTHVQEFDPETGSIVMFADRAAETEETDSPNDSLSGK